MSNDDPQLACGAPTTAGTPCQNPAGFGTDRDSGPCMYHLEFAEEPETASPNRNPFEIPTSEGARPDIEGQPSFKGAYREAREVVKDASAPTEAASERDGLLSYRGEWHAAGFGVGVGFAVAAAGDLRLLGPLVAAIAYGAKGQTLLSADLIRELRKESQYTFAALGAGLACGLLLRVAFGYSVPDATAVVEQVRVLMDGMGMFDPVSNNSTV